MLASASHQFPRQFRLRREQGAALLIVLAIIGVGAAYLLVSALNKANGQIGRDRVTSISLAQAKDALIGSAANYRNSLHPNEVFGFLPCPDTNNDGQADPPCGAADVSVIARLPWNTLGLPALRDSGGECLWLAVSGSAKDNPKTTIFNWDTAGQFVVQDAGGVVLAGGVAHERPLAMILAPRTVIGSQVRLSAGASECGGSNTLTDYIEGSAVSAVPGAVTTITTSTAASVASGSNNDQGLWIASKDIFDVVKKRSDFKSDIDEMVGDLSLCLNNLPPAALPAASPGNKGVDNALVACPAVAGKKSNVLSNWKDNLLYAKPVSAATVNGATGCAAVLFFGGERSMRSVTPLSAQTRVTAAEKGNATTYGDSAMYLEGSNASLFPASGAYTGVTGFSRTSSGADLVRCIKGLPAGAAQKSFASDFASFVPVGAGVSSNATDKTVTVASTGGAAGGCFWFPGAIPLAGKALRAYYDFAFSNADPVGGGDNGNGFTISFVRGDIPTSPTDLTPIPPNTCGTTTEMGVLPVGDLWGSKSLLVETDIHQDNVIQLDAVNVDPVGNHTSIMANGNLRHSVVAGGSGYVSAACDGSAHGCVHSPADKFEESPAPFKHNQRVEIHTGCNAACSSCDPTNHVAPNTYARIRVWSDCSDCSDVVVDFLGTGPTASRCIALNAALNSIYFGFTGGFRSGASAQSVTLSNFYLRSE